MEVRRVYKQKLKNDGISLKQTCIDSTDSRESDANNLVYWSRLAQVSNPLIRLIRQKRHPFLN